MRRTRPDVDRPFVTPAYPVLPAFTLGLYATLFGIITTTQPELALGGAGLLATLAIGGPEGVGDGCPEYPRCLRMIPL